MKPFRFHPDAETEMLDSAGYYETRQKGLGKHFLASVQNALMKISISSSIYPVIDGDIQRCLIETFPYAVLFRKMADQLVVIAIMHLHRDPNYWKQRNT